MKRQNRVDGGSRASSSRRPPAPTNPFSDAARLLDAAPSVTTEASSSQLPKALQIGARPHSPTDNPDVSDIHAPHAVDGAHLEDQSTIDGSGIESVLPRRPAREPPRPPGTELVSYSHRDYGSIKTKTSAWEGMANKQMPPEESDFIIKRRERGTDERLQRTYLEGEAMAGVHESAIVLDVGLTFLPGADKPQVNRIEQMDMANEEPDQKTAAWRVNTAGDLLRRFDVSADLAIVQHDQTLVTIDRARSRLKKEGKLFPEQRRAVNLGGRTYDAAVTIDSQHVKLVNDLRCRVWDIESTLIEVDSSSLWSLMLNFKHIIARGGPEMPYAETKMLLETMIEDARRLCIRSPILFRIATRSRIINSTDTRYGINHDSIMFQTLTTSAGIREIISLSASYYNSLDPTGRDNSVQKFIRPKFLQMIVLLLSFLNEVDLKKIADFLQSTYKLKADRIHLELLFIKVIPLLSINSKVFLKAMVPTVEGFPLRKDHEREEKHSDIWDIFVQRILRQGYLLPGTLSDLGRDPNSWIVKWPKDGFKSTFVFNSLQYSGSQFRAMNDIPPLEVRPEAHLTELTVVMTNGAKYTISSSDVEKITCLTPGSYTITESRPEGQSFDLEIIETTINADLSKAIDGTNTLVHMWNSWLTAPRRNGTLKDRLLRRNPNEFSFLNEFKGSGRLTKNIARLNQDILAASYKANGRKLTRTDCVRTIGRGIGELRAVVQHIERRMAVSDLRHLIGHNGDLKHTLEEVNNSIAYANGFRDSLNSAPDVSDEPIAKCLYPIGSDQSDGVIWHDYKAHYKQDEGLHMEAKRSTISDFTWLSDDIVEISIFNDRSKLIVSPLHPVDEVDRDEELQLGDFVMLAGQFVIIAEPAPHVQQVDKNYAPVAAFIMTNYLKIVSAEEASRPKRGMNRQQKNFEDTVHSLFR